MISKPYMCQVCGAAGKVWTDEKAEPPTEGRCDRHIGRDPCSIEGCTRSTKMVQVYSADTWLCHEHWRRFCPPRSRRRRAYRAFWREARKRGGWDADLTARYWKFWQTLIGSARARAEAGSIDIERINRMFGLDDD